MPTAGKFEDVVLRILTRSNTFKLDEIGVRERNLKVLKQIINRPYGLILCVGPTGSGKTTTLHAALGHINKPGVKIWTAEDSLTGHLVLSTLHTNNAPETLTRLLDMGMNALNISDSFLGVLAQRLVRRLCTKCQESYNPSKEEFEDIETDFGKKALAKAGYTFSPRLEFYRSLGCERCNGTGYKGRVGIHELMEGTPEIKILIKKNATSQELGKMAAKQGMETLKQDGIHKVFEGITDIREVRRVSVE
jgi:type II secretory ATPase GspE/PulE/Tfp pilus assembly ATPase PilB-like protein